MIASYWLVVITIPAMLLAGGLYKAVCYAQDYVPSYTTTDVTIKEMPMKEWVLNEVKRAGLDVVEADCIITHESRWDNWATHWNTNGSIDYGLWMINSVHKKTISVEDRFNYKKATRWAIAKRLHDGNWNAWVSAYKSCN